ncbi:TPA: hypothetical protein I7721_13255 [Vibrio vulnificus]|nr:hypothetical protein [Vibrio vulnificus]
MDGAIRICVILRPVAVLASFGYLGHILMYAPGDILTSPPCHKPDDSADFANKDVSASFRFVGYPAARI